MSMYFPDLKSVQHLAEQMSEQQKPEKKYRGINPQNEGELPEARRQLAHYMRTIWNDEVFAMEIELGVSKDDYDKKMRGAIFNVRR